METGGGQETGRGGAQELSASLFPPTSRNHSGDGALTAFADGFLRDERSGWHWGERRCSPPATPQAAACPRSPHDSGGSPSYFRLS